MAAFDYDVIILGAGPAGESAALNAVKHNKTAAIIDDRPEVGGACTHKGTIPSKALRGGVVTLMRYNSNPIIQNNELNAQFTFPRLLSKVADVIGKQVRMRSKFYSRNNIHHICGSASFVDANKVRVKLSDGTFETLTTKTIIVATGSHPFRPSEIDFSHPRAYDSDTILDMRHTPSKLVIYGAGVIGCEYASIFAGLGIKVDLINGRGRLLEFLDDEISDALSYHLRSIGVVVRHNEVFDRADLSDDGVTVHLQSGKRIRGAALLWCNGRTGNTRQLALENIGLSADARGNLDVDRSYQTAVENIYAVGDVIGWPSLASAAYNQGRAASSAALGLEHGEYVDDVPTGIYTIPEISSVGKTERELTEACVPYEVGRAFFKDTARGQISGADSGVLKILFHIDTLEILGVHCFGREATEIIHIGQAIMKQSGEGNTINYFLTNTFNYPTMAEAYRIAALNGVNRLAN